MEINVPPTPAKIMPTDGRASVCAVAITNTAAAYVGRR
jgi:hypothetical protein